MNIKYYLGQIIPRTYWTKYRTEDGKRHLSMWKMWFGKVYNHTDVVVSN